MKVFYYPQGGRWGYGFDYYCNECGCQLHSIESALHHPTSFRMESGIWPFTKITETASKCASSGKRCKKPIHLIECDEL